MSQKDNPPPSSGNPNYEIRLATMEDLDHVYEIEVLSFRQAYPKSLLWQLLKDKTAICLILESNQQVIGFAIGLLRSRKKGHIISIAIKPPYRKANYGSLLLEHLISELKEHTVSQIALEVRVSNEIALKLYKKFNFQVKEVKRRYYSDGEDAYFMIYNFDQ